MTEPCEIELKAKVIAFEEGLEPTEVVCPVKEICKKEHCIFIDSLEGVIYEANGDTQRLEALREELSKYKHHWTKNELQNL